MAQVYTFTDANGEIRLMAEINPAPGGSAFVPTAIKLSNGSLTDIHAAAPFEIKWNSATDPATNAPILVVPPALGLNIDLTGATSPITATEDGTWAFTLLVALSADATVKAGMIITDTDAALQFGPVDATDGSAFFGITASGVTTGSGAQATNFGVIGQTLAAAAANPYTIYCELTIVRLA